MNPQFSKSNPCIEDLFLCCSVLEFNSFLTLAFFLSVNVDFVAQSLASGTVEEWEKQILSSLIIIIALLEKKNNDSGKTLGLKLTIKKTT